jgi:hypothetical protein
LDAWRFVGDPPLLKLWHRLRAGDAVVVTLLRRIAALLFFVVPALVFGVAMVISLMGFHVSWGDVVFAMFLSVAMGAGVSVLGSLVFSVVFEITFGLLSVVVFGVSFAMP